MVEIELMRFTVSFQVKARADDPRFVKCYGPAGLHLGDAVKQLIAAKLADPEANWEIVGAVVMEDAQ